MTTSGTRDASIKSVRDITQWEGCQHQLKGHPTQQTSPDATYTAKSDSQSYPRSQYLKVVPQARLSILILSKTYPSPDIT